METDRHPGIKRFLGLIAVILLIILLTEFLLLLTAIKWISRQKHPVKVEKQGSEVYHTFDRQPIDHTGHEYIWITDTVKGSYLIHNSNCNACNYE